MDYNQSVQYLKGVGPHKARLFEKMGVITILDLLLFFPREYQNWGNLRKIADIQIGEIVTFIGYVMAFKEIRPFKSKGVKHILKMAVSDGTSVVHIVWFNQSYNLKKYSVGEQLCITGKAREGLSKLQIEPYEISNVEDGTLPTAKKYVPVYPLTEGLDQKILRKLIAFVLDEININFETLPDPILRKYSFIPRSESLKLIHFPENERDVEKARNRLVYEELFSYQIAYLLVKRRQEIQIKNIVYTSNYELIHKVKGIIPFDLTNSQKGVLHDIWKDMKSSSPMNRLLQGDVGSGKTIIVLFSLLLSYCSGYQSVLMVPTEVLANQHYKTFLKYFESININLFLLTSQTSSNDRKKIYQYIGEGIPCIVIGTHALIENNVVFKKLSLIVIDEQHRFGVIQRDSLRLKGGNTADVLIMTATPIPRTLSMSVYGDLDISVIDEIPPGRKPTKTKICESNSTALYEFIHENITKGRQAYFIYPLINETEKSDIKAVLSMHKELGEIFPDFEIGLVHGRQNKRNQQSTMNSFVNGEIDILVSTTVIEVGVDVPNANIIVIENAERFGLAQLHQLRGRVGRGFYESFCFLVSENNVSEIAKQRLRIMEETTDGFVIAEKDMKLRGPGEMIGTAQHGAINYYIANLQRDEEWLKLARDDAKRIINDDPTLSKEQNSRIKFLLKQYVREKINYGDVG